MDKTAVIEVMSGEENFTQNTQIWQNGSKKHNYLKCEALTHGRRILQAFQKVGLRKTHHYGTSNFN